MEDSQLQKLKTAIEEELPAEITDSMIWVVRNDTTTISANSTSTLDLSPDTNQINYTLLYYELIFFAGGALTYSFSGVPATTSTASFTPPTNIRTRLLPFPLLKIP